MSAIFAPTLFGAPDAAYARYIAHRARGSEPSGYALGV
jgi:hypothetical protein